MKGISCEKVLSNHIERLDKQKKGEKIGRTIQMIAITF